MTEGAQQAGSDKTAVHPFQVNITEAELTELRRRITAARWPERETVADDPQGVPLAMIQELADVLYAARLTALAMTASRMTLATMSGCDSIRKWEAPSTSVTVEPARS